jgi:beta-lactamase regulating signal transducer with metallopeptidase domain
MMQLLEILQAPAWRPLTWTLLHFVWQGAIVAMLWMVLFRLSRNCKTQLRYLLGLAGMFAMAVCPAATFVFLESEAARERFESNGTALVVKSAPAPMASKMPNAVVLPIAGPGEVQNVPSTGSDATPWRMALAARIEGVQPYLLCGWILGLAFFSSRLLMGVVGAHRLGRGRLALSGDVADRTARLAARMGFRAAPSVFSARAAREAVVTGLLRPIVLLPVAWLVEMTPEVLEAVIAHELAHIRRFDLWFNLFQRVVETLLFYHPAIWWLSRRVRLAREMCCDELAAAATGQRVVYATALELAARKRLEPTKSLLEVALGVTRMTLLDRVRNVLGLAARHEQGRWWPAAVLTLLAPLAVWFASMATVTSAQEEKQPVKEKPATATSISPALPVEKKQSKDAEPSPRANPFGLSVRAGGQAKNTATAFLRIAMQENNLLRGEAIQTDRDRFDIYKNTQATLLASHYVLRAALRNPKVAKLSLIRQQQMPGDAEKWLVDRLQVRFPGNAEVMAVSFRGDDPKQAVVLVNAIVDAYLSEVVNAESSLKQERLNELEKLYAERVQDLRKKQETLKSMARDIGASDSGALGVKQKLALEELALLRQEVVKSQSDLRRYEVELAVQKAFLEDAKDKDRAPILKEIKRIEVSVKVTTKQTEELAKLIQKMTDEAARYGLTSVSMDMLRADIKNMETVQAQLVSEMETLKVKLYSTPRVTLLERAE